MKLKPLPTPGDKKTVKKFALFPVQLVRHYSDEGQVYGNRIWLESYYEDKEYFFGYWTGGWWKTIRTYQQ